MKGRKASERMSEREWERRVNGIWDDTGKEIEFDFGSSINAINQIVRDQDKW